VDEREDRIKTLGERFKIKDIEKKSEIETKPKNKVRRTYYLDRELVEEVDRICRKLNYEMEGIAKSDFLETLLRYGLDNLKSVEQILNKSRK
jgi:hypothetical protein